MSGITVIGIVLLVVYGILAYSKPGIALLTVPFVAIAFGAWSAVLTEQPESVLFAPTLVLVTLVVAAFARREMEADSWAQRAAMCILIAAVVIVGSIAVVMCFVRIGAGFLLPLFFFLGIAAIIAGLIGGGVSGRRTATAVVFSTLGASMRQNLPLPMALDCAATGRRDAGARALRGIKKWLIQGYSLVESIRRGYLQCPSRFLAMLAAAEQVGQLPTAIVAIEADMKSQDIERHRFRPVHPIYPVIILGIAFLIVLALMTFIIPHFETVLAEMAEGPSPQRLPVSTRILMEIMHVVRWDLRFRLALGLVLLLGLLVSMHSRARGWRPDKPRWLSWIGDSIKWYLPVLRWFQNNWSLLQVVELLRLSLNAGITVNESIRATLQLDVNLHFRRRLKCWLVRVEQGEAIAAAARQCGLGSPLAWAFDADTGNAPAVLEMLESFYRSNYSYRVNLARFILWPCGIIALGCTVGFIVYALFTPGVAVVTQLAELVYP
jgi:type II secretory pathway component PulF